MNLLLNYEVQKNIIFQLSCARPPLRTLTFATTKSYLHDATDFMWSIFYTHLFAACLALFINISAGCWYFTNLRHIVFTHHKSLSLSSSAVRLSHHMPAKVPRLNWCSPLGRYKYYGGLSPGTVYSRQPNSGSASYEARTHWSWFNGPSWLKVAPLTRPRPLAKEHLDQKLLAILLVATAFPRPSY